MISSESPPTGHVHNVNADTAAAALAVALGAEKLLVLLTDVEGLYRDWPDSDDVIGQISPEALERLVTRVVASGNGAQDRRLPSRPSPGACRAPHIDGRETPHAVLLEIFTDDGVGTQCSPASRPDPLASRKEKLNDERRRSRRATPSR